MSNFTPPLRQGVGASRAYLPKINPTPVSIFAYLCEKFSQVTSDVWRQRFFEQMVLDEQGIPLAMDTPYQHGRTIYYYKAVANEPVVPFCHQIIFENENLLVVDKPHFLTVAPAGRYVEQTLLSRLKNATQNPDLSPIHRLDRETAGLILFSKNPASRAFYQSLFAEQQIHKIYHAIAPFRADLALPCDLSLHLQRGEPFYTMTINPDAPPNTHTHIERIAISDDGRFAKYRLSPSTGKLHQLRVHLNHLGIPICNDSFYPVVRHKADDDFSKPLQLLAKTLEFVDPLTGERHYFESPQELDFGQVLADEM